MQRKLQKLMFFLLLVPAKSRLLETMAFNRPYATRNHLENYSDTAEIVSKDARNATAAKIQIYFHSVSFRAPRYSALTLTR